MLKRGGSAEAQAFIVTKEGLTSNFADYDTCAPHVCCGWLSLHHDIGYGATWDSPWLTLEPLFWDPDAVFVATDELGRFVEIPREQTKIRFLGTRLHGLLPRKVADEVLRLQSAEGPLLAAFEKNLEPILTSPKMIWVWHEASMQDNG